MAKGKKYPDEIKEKAYFMYATSGSVREVARELGIAVSTVSGWLKARARDAPDEFEQVRTEKKLEFIDKSSSIIDKALALLDRRLTRALKEETELDLLIDEIFTADKEEISDKEKQTLISKVRNLQLYDIKALTTAMGTLYDKRALAKGESTENTKVEIILPEEANEYAE